MDATEFGVQIFFTILLPGFFSWSGFRLTSGSRHKNGDFASICYAALFGVLLISLMGSKSEQVTKIIANPIPGGVALGMAGFIIGLLVGIPFGWLRSKFR